MKKKRFDTPNKINQEYELICLCSLNNWSIFATRKRNGIRHIADHRELRKMSTPDSKWCHSSVGRAMD